MGQSCLASGFDMSFSIPKDLYQSRPSARREPALVEALDTLLTLQYPLPDIRAEQAIPVLDVCCSHLRNTDVANRFRRLIILLFSKQKLVLGDKHLATLSKCLDGLLTLLSEGDGDDVETLRALSTILYENGVLLSALHGSVLTRLRPIAMPSDQPLPQRQLAISCLGNMCARTGPKFQSLHDEVYKVVMDCLKNPPMLDMQGQKVIASALGCLNIVLSESKSLMMSSPDTVLPLLQKYMFGQPSSRTLRQSSGMLSLEQFQNRLVSDSDSDASFTRRRVPGGNAGWRVLMNCLTCLQLIAKQSPKATYPHWGRFIPGTISIGDGILIRIVSSHELPVIRSSGYQALGAMVEGSKGYLSVAADSSGKRSAFTTLSQKLADQIEEMHRGLLLAIKAETDVGVMKDALLCCSILVDNCTYDRLAVDHRCELFLCALDLARHSDPTIQLSALSLITHILYSGIGLPDTIPTVDPTKVKKPPTARPPSSSSMAESALMRGSSVLSEVPIGRPLSALDFALDISSDNSKDEKVRIASIDVMTALAPMDGRIIRSSWDKIDTAIGLIWKAHPNLCGSICRFLVQCAPIFSSESVDGRWFEHVLDAYIQNAVSDHSAALRSLACEWLSQLNEAVFATLPQLQRTAIVLTMSALADEDPTVRASACHTVGVYVLLSVFREDALFMHDIGPHVIPLVSDANLTVRARASWALANLCDAYAALRVGSSLSEVNVDDNILRSIFKAGLQASKDNDKCRANGVRALGNAVAVCSPALLEKECEGMVAQIVLSLIKNMETGSVKTRWNACHATQLMFTNPAFPLGTASWTTKLFTSLIDGLTKSKNYKVRINACSALQSTPSTSEAFRDANSQGSTNSNLQRAIEAIIAAAIAEREGETGAAVAEFGEYKYKEQFVTQVF
ncbi:armadillo-type protein [Cladochytrium replicatum]|nr:armadillo-type protein [Cladochytrium replicatum]